MLPLLAVATLLVASPTAFASPSTDIEVLDAGLEAYLAGDTAEAVRRWSVASDAGARERLSASPPALRTLREDLGSPTGFEVIGRDQNAPNLRIIYARLRHTDGDAFARFVLRRFDPQSAWALDRIHVGQDEATIVPLAVSERGAPYWVPPARDD